MSLCRSRFAEDPAEWKKNSAFFHDSAYNYIGGSVEDLFVSEQIDAIRKAGMLLTDEELDKVAGGQDPRIIRDCNSCPAKYERNCEGCPAYHG